MLNTLKVLRTKANAVLRTQLFKVVKYNNIKTIHVKNKVQCLTFDISYIIFNNEIF